MDKNENVIISINQRKEKIRERYKGINKDELDLIPALPNEDFYNGEIKKRVGVYARVSTDDPRQTTSYELQKNHYEDMVLRRPNWELVKIYADEGISGTSLKHRDAFLEMIKDCEEHKIDLIVTKSVARFARNVVDCIGYVRTLAGMDPPIGVFFETENIYTLDKNAEMSLSFISTLAQEESHTKSEIMNSSIEMRFSRGIFLTPVLLGYDHDDNGNLIINESEAITVRLAFYMCYIGYSLDEISSKFTELKRKTKKGNITWSSSTILSLLQNERYCGDVLARKTWTPNYLDHKSKKNRQNRNQYLRKNNHDAIVPRELFISVQHILSNRKYGRHSHLPYLHVIGQGTLKGFVSINPCWANFHINDYLDASDCVYSDSIRTNYQSNEFLVKPGELDLRSYKLTHGEFLNSISRPSIFLSKDTIRFSSASILELLESNYVELLIHPRKCQLIVRPVSNCYKNRIKWKDKHSKSRIITGTAFLPTVYKLCNLNENYKYRIIGRPYIVEDKKILLFDLNDNEILIPEHLYDGDHEHVIYYKKYIKQYPKEWNSDFGDSIYHEDILTFNDSFYDTFCFSSYYPNPELIYPISDIQYKIQLLLENAKKEIVNE